MKILGILLTVLGAVTLYCCHSNQDLLKQQLAKPFQCLGIFSVIFGFVFLFISLPKVVACFVWIITLLCLWSIIPFLPFFRRNQPL